MGCINWAWKIQGLKSNEKVLLLAIADRADKESGVCVSPVVRLSRDAGGWSRQQTNRVLKRLEGYGLVRVNLRFPGTDDPSRIYTCQITLDPEQWRPKDGQGRQKQERYYVNLKKFSGDLHGRILTAFATKHLPYSDYENWLSALHPIELGKGRLVCRIPSHDFSAPIWEYRDLILEIASSLEPAKPIKRLKFIWDRPQKPAK